MKIMTDGHTSPTEMFAELMVSLMFSIAGPSCLAQTEAVGEKTQKTEVKKR